MNTGIMPLIAAILFLREASKDYIIFGINGFRISTKCHINNFL